MKNIKLILGSLVLVVIAVVAYRHWVQGNIADRNLQEVANGDAQFWLMQGGDNQRLMPCTVYYQFHAPLNPSLVRDRLRELVTPYAMFKRNIVEVDGLPYWQTVPVNWNENFRVLGAGEDIESVRAQAEREVSRAAESGEGLPLFRAYLSADHKQLVFVWHHVISDLEGMFNKHARHLFREPGERTQYGYQQVERPQTGERDETSTPATGALKALGGPARPLGFTGADYDVTEVVLPVKDTALYSLGQRAGLPMSDLFSFIALRAATRYEASLNQAADNTPLVRPMLSPISLRSSSLDMDEGNNRAVRIFQFIFPLENVSQMHKRIIRLEPTSGSYDTAGKLMKLARKASVAEPLLRKISMPDYISNYFPLADGAFMLGESRLLSHRLRVPMVPYERTKFAWSNYNGDVQLFLHTDPVLIDRQRMLEAFDTAFDEVLGYLGEGQ